jgi:hypothetical protein
MQCGSEIVALSRAENPEDFAVHDDVPLDKKYLLGIGTGDAYTKKREFELRLAHLQARGVRVACVACVTKARGRGGGRGKVEGGEGGGGGVRKEPECEVSGVPFRDGHLSVCCCVGGGRARHRRDHREAR